jgi:uncharacterized protein (TIGR01777 family)
MIMKTEKKRIILAGGSGFLGQSLANELLEHDYEVIVLTRSPHESADGFKEVKWDGEHLGEWIQFLDGAEAVVNLTGRSVNCRHTPENVREINESRVNSVRALTLALDHIKNPPRVWVQSGSLALYGDTDDRWCDENTPAGQGEATETCKLWENSFNSVNAPDTRKILLRIGFVLDRDGGALSVLGNLAKWFLGGSVGSGRQYISWIHLADMNRMFLEAIEREDLNGAFNATSPNPATNAEFMRELRRALHRPWSPPVPVWAVHFGSRLMQTEPSLALTGRRCAPKKFMDAGFKFEFPELRGALADIYK